MEKLVTKKAMRAARKRTKAVARPDRYCEMAKALRRDGLPEAMRLLRTSRLKGWQHDSALARVFREYFNQSPVTESLAIMYGWPFEADEIFAHGLGVSLN